MTFYHGRLMAEDMEPTRGAIDIEDGRFRLVAGRRQLGSWNAGDVAVNRTSVYRFTFTVDQREMEFYPDDPTGFSDASGAVIDLTETKGRFGIRARLERLSNGG